jgi:hypothetical protein
MVEGRGVEGCFWRKLGGLFEVVEGVLSGGHGGEMVLRVGTGLYGL